MLNIDILYNNISDNEDSLNDIDNAHLELAKEESTGMLEVLEYLLNSELIQWKSFFDKKTVYSVLKRCNESINFDKSTPSIKNIFKPYYINPNKVKLMIIGMDPYPQMVDGFKVANGIPFDVNINLKNTGYIPKSLENFLNELKYDLDIDTSNFSFDNLISQNIFIVNYAHTVNIGSAVNNSSSHMEIWGDYTKLLVEYIIENNKDIVICILGSSVYYNLRNEVYILKDRCVFTAHPSGRGQSNNPFQNSKIFSKINSMLNNPIQWIPNI